MLPPIPNTQYPIPNTQHPEGGNAFFFILLGIILFAALAMAFSYNLHSDTTSRLGARKADLLASDILSHAEAVDRALSKILSKGISENDISFENGIVSGYAHTPAVPSANRVFDPLGGRLGWQNPAREANDGSAWIFTGATCIPGLGTGASGCAADGAGSNEELLMVLPNIAKAVCEKIDERLGIAAVPADTGDGPSAIKYTGSYSDGNQIVLPHSYRAACASRAGAWYFYYVLLSR